jgi:hypothetical protein
MPQLTPAESWYERPADRRGAEVSSLVKAYRDAQAGRRARYIRNLEVYEGRHLGGYSAHAYCDSDDKQTYLGQRLRLVRSAVATAVANIYAPQKPKPQFQTLGATWALRRRAYRLDKICEGILNQRQDRWINGWAMMIDAAAECALQGTAVISVMADHARKRIVHDLVPSCDVFTDPVEGRMPRNYFMRRPCGVDEAMERYGKGMGRKIRDAIANAPPYEWYGESRLARPRSTKVIQLDFGWKLPDSKDAPGVWALGIGGETVDGGEWTAPAPPLVFLQWEPHRDGVWAAGIADEGGPMSEDCDDFDMRLCLRQRIASGAKGFYERDSVKNDDLAVNDAITWIAVEKGAMPPQIALTPAFTQMEFEFHKYKVSQFWDTIGLSQVSAAARREQGVNSGVAIRTLNDTKAGRQLVKAQRYEQSYVDLGHQYVWRLRELAEDDKNFMVQWSGRSLIRQIKWNDADVEDDSFAISVAPASALPHDPAGRQEMVQDLYKGGLISQETAKQLMGWPDFDSELEVENAETEYVDMLIERYLDADEDTWTLGDYQAPEGFVMNKVGAIRRFASAWFRARIDQAALPTPEERLKVEFNLKLLSRYIQEMDKLMQPPEQPPAAPVAQQQLPGNPMGPAVPPGPQAVPPPMAAA